MAQSSTKRVYVPQDVNVTLPASRENPGGRVVQLKAGYCELDEACQVHPLLSRLQAVDPDEYDRQDKLREAQHEYDEAVGKAAEKLAKARMEVDQERRETIAKSSEDYVERRERAQAAGAAFVEPHPDPETQRAMALTAPAAQFATVNPGAFALTPTAEERDAARKTRESMPTEEENRKAMATTSSGLERGAARGRLPKESQD